MKRKISKMVVWIVAFMMVVITSGCGTAISNLPSGNTTEMEGSEGVATTEEVTKEELTTEEQTTEELTTQEATPETLSTKEPTPYDAVVDVYLAQWAKLYMDEEDSGFDTKRWEFVQNWKETLGGIRFQNVEVTCVRIDVLDETEDEVRIWVDALEILPYTTTPGNVRTMKCSPQFIIRLAKQEGEYGIASVSYCDWMLNFEMGLEEDLKLLRRPTGSVAD